LIYKPFLELYTTKNRPMKITFLDTYSIGNADLTELSKLGEFSRYETTAPKQVVERCVDADVVITNKVKLLRDELQALPNLRLICIAATGMNNVDLEYAAQKGITVKNVADYSTNSVAELTFTLALNLIHHLHYYDHFVKWGAYTESGLFTHHSRSFSELKGKKWGIIGMGNIGKRVAEIATVFGAEVAYYSTSGKNLDAGFPHMSLEALLRNCQIVSIHAPLYEMTQNLLDYQKLCLMKPEAYLINVGRGGIVNESDLAKALRENKLAGAGVDVFSQEPPTMDNPLLAEDIADKLLLTPHLAWASMEARQRLVDTMVEHIKALL
jgi:lactate dehydrogenase-like 2-hydroxyacid dehydrogenase